MENCKTRLKAFITTHVNTPDINDSDDIFGLGLIDSMFAMQLVLFVESEFQLSIDNEDLDFDNFRSIDSIAQFVRRKTGGALR